MSKRPVIEKSPNYGFYADALWCTVPLLALACYNYGLRPALLYLAALLTAYVCDCLVTPLHAPGYQTHEPSSEYFAAVIVMLMPATAPYATVVMAVIVSVLVKEAFGGEGHYPFHPAAVGMIVAALSWPSNVLRYPAPGTVLPLFGSVDSIVTTAGMNPTLRDGGLPTASTVNLLIGSVSGPMGTVGALVIVACGLYLLARGRLRLSTLIPMLTVMVLLPWLLPRLGELPVFSLPWEYVRQRLYLEKYVLLGGSTLFGAAFMACEPVTQPDRTSSRIAYGLLLGVMCTVFRFYSGFEAEICFALVIAGAFPEWLDRISRRAERMRFMRKEEERLAANQQKKPRR